MELSKLSDEALYNQCREYGALALMYRRKFIGLLPEVNRRHLFLNKGFSSIFEFAFKLGGLSEEQVKRAIRLDEQFEDKPLLGALLKNGDVSINKLARVAAIATPETEEFWAKQVQNLPKRALEVLVHDAHNERLQEDNNMFLLNFVPGHHLKISPEIENKLLELQNKGLDLNTLLLEFLQNRDEQIAREKDAIQIYQTISRHIPQRTKNILKKEHGSKCSIPACKRRAEAIHHTQRFSLSKTHDPHYLAPLCKQHHQIAHSIDQKITKHYAPPPHHKQSGP